MLDQSLAQCTIDSLPHKTLVALLEPITATMLINGSPTKGRQKEFSNVIHKRLFTVVSGSLPLDSPNGSDVIDVNASLIRAQFLESLGSRRKSAGFFQAYLCSKALASTMQ